MVEYRAVPPKHPDAGLHLGDGQTVHAGSVRAAITFDPSNATNSVAGSYTKLNRPSNLPGSAVAQW